MSDGDESLSLSDSPSRKPSLAPSMGGASEADHDERDGSNEPYSGRDAYYHSARSGGYDGSYGDGDGGGYSDRDGGGDGDSYYNSNYNGDGYSDAGSKYSGSKYSGSKYDPYADQYSASGYDGYSKYSGGGYSKYSGYSGYGDGYSGYGYDEGHGEDGYGEDGYGDEGSVGSSAASRLSGLSYMDGDEPSLLDGTAPASRLAAAEKRGAKAGAAAVASLGREEEEEESDENTYVGLGIQLQEPAEGGGGGGFVVTRLIRGAPGDKCGLILEGDVLIAVDGRSIGALRFAEVSALLAGPEGVPISLQFERVVKNAAEGRTRTYDVALRRERFYLNDEEDDTFDDDDDGSLFSEGGGLRKRKADYWEGYRAAMAHKAPPFATSIASFESDDDDDDKLSDAPSLPVLPASPDGSDRSDDPTELEQATEAHLAGALAAGATVGLPAPEQLNPLPSLAQIDAKEAAEAAAEREAIGTLSGGARKWAERLSQWDTTLRRDLEGMSVKSELLDMWRLKLTRVRLKLGVDEKAMAAQEEAVSKAVLPPPRESDGSRSTAEVLQRVREGGAEGTASLLTELQRQMVEAERWRAESKRMATQLKKARDEVGRRGKEMQTMRAQNITWSSDNKARRDAVRSAHGEVEELRKSNAAVVSQASTLEERVAKLQDEVTLKSELAAMWRRSAERGGGGGGSEAEAAALTWKLETEKAVREGERWKAAARKSEELLRDREEEALRARVEAEEAKLEASKKASMSAHAAADAAPLEEMKHALLSAQDDLASKAEEANGLARKVQRLEAALSQIM